jgi:G:T-mismatch repair DNA endonuclease (very short patch repair protein)
METNNPYDNHVFIRKTGFFYKDEVSIDNEVYNKSEEYWQKTVSKNLTKDELGVQNA